MSKRGILIVDDVADTRELLAELLTMEGYHAIMAGDVRAAWVRMEEVRPDLILTDLMMPEASGADFVDGLAADPELRHIPVLLLTGAGPDRINALLGTPPRHVASVITKPFVIERLLEAIASVLGE